MDSGNYHGTFRVRRDSLLTGQKDHEARAIIVFKHEDIYYLTGFFGKDSGSILVLSPEKTYLLVNFIYYEEARQSVDNNIDVVLYKDDRLNKAADILSSSKISILETDGADISQNDFSSLRKKLEKTGIKISAKKDILRPFRMIKDTHELDTIKEACRITDRAFDRLLGLTASEMAQLDELSLSNRLEGLCMESGGSGRSFDYVIASGPGSSRPHYISSHRQISEGILLMDFGTRYNNYCSDITRTVFAGRGPEKRLKDIYKIVLEAQLRAIDACRAGIRCDQLDNIARKYIEDNGYGGKFGHSLGHGVGLEIHEGPYVSARDRTVLEENMVITIEPGIYIQGLGGVRIEDMVVVEKNSCLNLYSSKKDFTFLI
jgi:Xaa-Pro aminopeptidase